MLDQPPGSLVVINISPENLKYLHDINYKKLLLYFEVGHQYYFVYKSCNRIFLNLIKGMIKVYLNLIFNKT